MGGGGGGALLRRYLNGGDMRRLQRLTCLVERAKEKNNRTMFPVLKTMQLLVIRVSENRAF